MLTSQRRKFLEHQKTLVFPQKWSVGTGGGGLKILYAKPYRVIPYFIYKTYF